MVSKYITRYIEEERRVLDRLELGPVEAIVDMLYEAYIGGRQIFVFGNGGSGSTASHFTCDINKGVGYGLDKRFRMICLNDNVPLLLAYANDISYSEVFVGQLKNFLNPGDVVIGISGSGNSENVIKALEHANQNGARAAGFAGFDGGRLSRVAEATAVVPANDMQQIEDVHLMLTHVIMQVFYERLHVPIRHGAEPDSRAEAGETY